jgi:hypothetical protein
MRAGSAREISDTNVGAEHQAPSLRPRLAWHEFDFWRYWYLESERLGAALRASCANIMMSAGATVEPYVRAAYGE